MITGKNHIIAYFDSVGNPYYAIFYKGKVEKGNAIRRNDKDGETEYDFQAGKESFEKTLQLLDYGDYTLVTSDTKNVTNRGNISVDFRISLTDQVATTAPQVSGFGIGAVSMEQVEQKANDIATKRFQELMDKKELADTKAKNVELEKEVKELDKRTTDPWNKLLQAAAPHSEAIIAGIMGKPVFAKAISGVAADVIGSDMEAQKVSEDFIEALAIAKPTDWKKILIQLTTLIKTTPHKFDQALTFL